MQPLVKNRIIEILGYFWNRIFLDSDFVESWATTVAVPVDDLNKDFQSLPEYMSRYTIPIKEPRALRLFIFDEAAEDRIAVHYGDSDVVYGDGTFYGQETGLEDARRFPIDDGFEPQFLATSITDPGAILERGVDYEIEDNWILFRTDPEDLDSVQKKAYLGTNRRTFFQFFLWGFQVLEDLEALCNFYGTMAGLCGPSNLWTKEAINVAWDLRVDGASVRNTQRLLAVMTHTDYVYEDGVVRDVCIEGDRICVRTDTSIYTAPSEARAVVSKGDSITADQIIFDTYNVHQAADEIPGPDFDGLSLGPEYMTALGAPVLFPNVRVDIEKVKNPGWFTVRSQ